MYSSEDKKALDNFKLEGMTGYFANVRNKFIKDSNSWWLDNFFVNSILVRAYQINKGFIELTNNGNYLCAAPLVRMQLETLCRCYGGLIADGDSYIPRYMQGKKVDNQTFQGKQLTYTTLVKLLSEHFELTELTRIYEEGNAFIHPTDIAFKASLWNQNRYVTVQNLGSKLYEDSEMEAIIDDMKYVNLCYTPVLEKYEELLNANLELSKGAIPEPVTDPDQQKKVKDTIESFLDNIKRETNESTK